MLLYRLNFSLNTTIHSHNLRCNKLCVTLRSKCTDNKCRTDTRELALLISNGYMGLNLIREGCYTCYLNIEANILSQIPNGETVDVYCTTGLWYVIEYNGMLGFVSAQYINIPSA